MVPPKYAGLSRRQFLVRATRLTTGAALLPWLSSCHAAPATRDPLATPFPATEAAPIRTHFAGTARTLSPHFLGFNGKVVQVPPWQDARFLDAVVDLGPATLRYPPGTWGNYWDWRTGWFAAGTNPPGISPGKTPDPRKLDDFALAIKATGAKPIFILNMLSATLDDQLAMLHAADQLGLAIELVELGNEFYISGNPDFLRRFPTAKEYGREASRWAAAVKDAFPAARLAAVGAADAPNGSGKGRARDWNRALLPTLHDIDALTLHLYPQPNLLTGRERQAEAQLSEGGPGTAALQAAEAAALATPAGLATFLGRPFQAWSELAASIAALPAGRDCWLTEYNLGDPSGAIFGTWGHGLFVATLTLLFLNEPRVTLTCNHVIASNTGAGNGAFAAIYCSTNAFSGFADAPATTPYTLSPGGAALRLLNRAMRGMTTAQRLDFTPTPLVRERNGTAYPALLGWAFGQQDPTQGLVINLSNQSHQLDVTTILPQATHFAQLSGEPHLRLAGAEALRQQSAPLARMLTLAPYSLTHAFTNV